MDALELFELYLLRRSCIKIATIGLEQLCISYKEKSLKRPNFLCDNNKILSLYDHFFSTQFDSGLYISWSQNYNICLYEFILSNDISSMYWRHHTAATSGVPSVPLGTFWELSGLTWTFVSSTPSESRAGNSFFDRWYTIPAPRESPVTFVSVLNRSLTKYDEKKCYVLHCYEVLLFVKATRSSLYN